MFVGMRGAGDSGRSGEGSVVRIIILWILSREERCNRGETRHKTREQITVRYLLAEILSARGVIGVARNLAEMDEAVVR